VGSRHWGSNAWGQLGNGASTISNSDAPTLVSGGLTFSAISVGMSQTCGITTAGAAYCWGNGELIGQASTTPLNSNMCPGVFSGTGQPCNTLPMPVVGVITFASISAGGDQTCGITTSGAGYCWGIGGYGGLGTGSLGSSPTPAAVSGSLTFATMSSGREHVCGKTTDSAVYCWGYNADGELGNGTTTNSTTPMRVLGP